jgi:hypothetical protein
MATLIWTSVFLFLLLELVAVFILVVPVPRKIRNFICRQISKLNLKEHLHFPCLCIGIALAFGLVDGIFALQWISKTEKEAHDESMHQEHSYFHHHDSESSGGVLRELDKQREYKTERNMYLTGFALTLLFVIGRIADLMQEHVELGDEYERVQQDQKKESSREEA